VRWPVQTLRSSVYALYIPLLVVLFPAFQKSLVQTFCQNGVV